MGVPRAAGAHSFNGMARPASSPGGSSGGGAGTPPQAVPRFRKMFAADAARTRSLPKAQRTVALQGYVVCAGGDGRALLDDGSAVVMLGCERLGPAKAARLRRGRYVRVNGIVGRKGSLSIQVAQAHDLSRQPHAEPLWWLEIAEFARVTGGG